MDGAGRVEAIEENRDLEAVYRSVATRGDSEVPTNPEDEVDFHYVCFVKSHSSSVFYELDGDRKGPMNKCSLGPEEDALADQCLTVVREYISRERGGNPNFGLLALASSK